MRVLELPAGRSPRETGRFHGKTLAPLIREIAAIRVRLVVEKAGFPDERRVLRAGRMHLPLLKAFSERLYDELTGIAEGADVDPGAIVVLNHYTDLKDLNPRDIPHDDDCSILYARTPEGVLLGQTWDMHGSALPYVTMLRVPAYRDTPGAWMLTIAGCLGMAGMNDAGVGITINNLRSSDSRLGVVWPALVRKMIEERSAEAARDVLMGARLGAGHHYLVATGSAAFGVETSGLRKELTFVGDATRPNDAYVHTNHCLNPSVSEVSSIAPGSTTLGRFAQLTDGLATPVTGVADLWKRFQFSDGTARSISMPWDQVNRMHETATCGAIAMNLTTREVFAAGGNIVGVDPQPFPVPKGA